MNAHTAHYHIRWLGKDTLDWESFTTWEEAEARAKELVRLHETYTVEDFDGDCPRCQATLKTVFRTPPEAKSAL